MGGPRPQVGLDQDRFELIPELGGQSGKAEKLTESAERGPATRVVDHVEDVRAIADRLGIDGFSITGNSGGAPHALAVAARLPDRVVRVSNTGAIAPLDLMGLDEWQRNQDSDTREYTAAVRARIGRTSGPMLAAEPVEASCNRGADGRSRATLRAEPLPAAVVRPVNLCICS